MRRLPVAAAAAAGLGFASTVALAYAIDFQFDSHGLDIDAKAVEIDSTAVVSITNHEPFAVFCEAEFRNGPEPVKRRRAEVEPGQTLPMKWTPGRTVVRLRISLWCESESAVSPGEPD
jgi:hypothetical protein